MRETLSKLFYPSFLIKENIVFIFQNEDYVAKIGIISNLKNELRVEGLILSIDDCFEKKMENFFKNTDIVFISDITMNQVYVRRGIDSFKRIDKFPSYYSFFRMDFIYITLKGLCGFCAGIEMFVMSMIAVVASVFSRKFYEKIYSKYSEPNEKYMPKRHALKVISCV